MGLQGIQVTWWPHEKTCQRGKDVWRWPGTVPRSGVIGDSVTMSQLSPVASVMEPGLHLRFLVSPRAPSSHSGWEGSAGFVSKAKCWGGQSETWCFKWWHMYFWVSWPQENGNFSEKCPLLCCTGCSSPWGEVFYFALFPSFIQWRKEISEFCTSQREGTLNISKRARYTLEQSRA